MTVTNKRLLVIHYQKDDDRLSLKELSYLWVIKLIFPKCKIIGWPLKELNRKLFDTNEDVLIIDLEVNSSNLNKWSNYNNNITYISTDITSFENLNSLYNISLKDIKNSSLAILVWRHYFKDESIPYFLKVINDQGTYKLPFSKEIIKSINEEVSTYRNTEQYLLFNEIKNLTLQQLVLRFVSHNSYYINTRKNLVVNKKLLAIPNIDLLEDDDNSQNKKNSIVDNTIKYWSVGSINKFKVPIVKLAPNENKFSNEVCCKLSNKFSKGSKFYTITKILPKYVLHSLYKHQLLKPPFIGVLTNDNRYVIQSTKGKFNVEKVAIKLGGYGYQNIATFNTQ